MNNNEFNLTSKHFYQSEFRIPNIDSKCALLTINLDKSKKENKYLYEHKKDLGPVHNIFVLDRSASMYYKFDLLMSNVIKAINYIKDDDYITIMWFCDDTEEVEVLIQGASASLRNSIISKLNELNVNTFIKGGTCFSKPIEKIINVINMTKNIINGKPNIMLFTDGMSCPYNLTALEDTKNSLDRLDVYKNDNELLSFNTIGHGKYLDEEFLKDLSNKSKFGEYVHISDNSQIYLLASIFNNDYDVIKNIVSSYKIEMSAYYLKDNKNIDYEFIHIHGTKNSSYSKNQSKYMIDKFNVSYNKVHLIFNNLNMNYDPVINFVIKNHNDQVVQTYNYYLNEVEKSHTLPMMEKFYYLYSKHLLQYNNKFKALNLLLLTGDKFSIDSTLNYFTMEEKGNLIKHLEKCYVNKTKRSLKGNVSRDYLPNNNCFNVLDLLLDLSKNKGVTFVLQNFDKYNRTTMKNKDTLNKFIELDKVFTSNASKLVFNENEVNISINFELKGIVNIDKEDQEKYNLPINIKTSKFRNMTIVKDGNLNVDKLTIRINNQDFNKLSQNTKDFILSPYRFGDCRGVNKIYKLPNYLETTLDLTLLPITNRVNNINDLEEIYENVNTELELRAYQKVYNTFIKEHNIGSGNNTMLLESNSQDNSFCIKEINEETLNLLSEKYGINKSLHYSGKYIKDEENSLGDSYKTRSLTFDIKGYTSLPSIKAIKDKKKKGKKLNNIEILMLNKYIELDLQGIDEVTVNDYSNKIYTELNNIISSLKNIRYKLFKVRLIKLCTGDFWELNDRFVQDEKNNDKYYYTSMKNSNDVLVVKCKYLTINI